MGVLSRRLVAHEIAAILSSEQGILVDLFLFGSLLGLFLTWAEIHRPGLSLDFEIAILFRLVDFDVSTWFALALPKGAPAAIVRKLNDATVAAMNG